MDLENLKDQIKDYELDFDQNEVWSNIEKEQKKDKRRILLWLSSLLGMLLLVVGVFHLVDRSIGTNESVIANDIINVNSTIQNRKSENKIIDTQDQITTNSKIESNSKKINNATNSIVGKEFKEKDVSEDIQDNDLAYNTNEKDQQENYTSQDIVSKERPKSNLNDGLKSFTLSVNNNQSNNLFFKENRNSNTQSNERKSAVITSDVNDRKNESIVINVSKENISETKTELLPRDQIVVFDIDRELTPIAYNYRIDIANGEIAPMENTEPLKEISNKNLQLKLVSEYGMLKRNLGLSDSGQNNSLLSSREESEEAIDHFIVGLHISMPITNTFYITSGIEYHRMSDKLNYSNTEINPLDPEDPLVAAKNAYGYVISSSSGTYYNHLNLINVPLELGARWTQSRFSQFISLGTSINVNTTSRQLYINEFDNLEDDRNIKSSLNNSYIVKTGIGLEISSDMEWSLHASYRYTPNVHTDESAFTQSYQSYMIGTGLAYKF